MADASSYASDAMKRVETGENGIVVEIDVVAERSYGSPDVSL